MNKNARCSGRLSCHARPPTPPPPHARALPRMPPLAMHAPRPRMPHLVGRQTPVKTLPSQTLFASGNKCFIIPDSEKKCSLSQHYVIANPF